MTAIKCSIGDGEYTLEADGHAAGSPEACAGISAIVETLDGYLTNASGEHVYSIHEKWVEDGTAGFSASGDDALGEVWRAACIGLMKISLSYPDFVSVNWEEKNF